MQLYLTVKYRSSAQILSNNDFSSNTLPLLYFYFLKVGTPRGVHFKLICIKSLISTYKTYKKCAGIITNRAATALNVQMVLLHFESRTS